MDAPTHPRRTQRRDSDQSRAPSRPVGSPKFHSAQRGLVGEEDPAPVIVDVLAHANNEVEAFLTLNTVVLLHDLKGYQFDIDPEIFPAEWRAAERSEVNRRLGYLNQ